jgi:predicted metal-dependent hydrolase
MMSDFVILDTVAGRARLKRSERKTLAISVMPDGTLELVAPLMAREEMIQAKVAKRKAWISKQRREFETMNAKRPALRYVSGATHRYLGRQYRLKVEKGDAPGVLLKGGFLHVRVRTSGENEVREALQSWYRERAKMQFSLRLAEWENWCAKHKLPKPRLRLRAMTKRWGSALKGGTICLNPELIRASALCIDYVIAHEVCHLRHPDHGKKFWNLLAQIMPDWKQRKARLESSGE